MVLSGEGRSFCAGADIGYMRETAALLLRGEPGGRQTPGQDVLDRRRVPEAAGSQSAGGGDGGWGRSLAVADVAVADEEARFAFSEVRLGIAPATISPFVVRKVGASHARSLFVTGERFGAERAREIGLVHGVVSQAGLDASSR